MLNIWGCTRSWAKTYLHGKKLKLFCFCLCLCYFLFLFPGILFIIPFYFICFPFFLFYPSKSLSPWFIDHSPEIHKLLAIKHSNTCFVLLWLIFFFYIYTYTHTKESRALVFYQIIIPLIETLQKLHTLTIWWIEP